MLNFSKGTLNAQIIIGVFLILIPMLIWAFSAFSFRGQGRQEPVVFAVSADKEVLNLVAWAEFESPLPTDDDPTGELKLTYNIKDADKKEVEVSLLMGQSVADRVHGCDVSATSVTNTYEELGKASQLTAMNNYRVATANFDNNPESREDEISVATAQSLLKGSVISRVFSTVTPDDYKDNSDEPEEALKDAKWEVQRSITCQMDMSWTWDKNRTGYVVEVPQVTAGGPGESKDKYDVIVNYQLPNSPDIYFDRGNGDSRDDNGLFSVWGVGDASGSEYGEFAFSNTPILNMSFKSVKSEDRREITNLALGAVLGAGVSLIATSLPGVLGRRSLDD